ncbi:hypothetical protein [Bradyrhizobium sp. LHD-71]|uniref:hypothetical protein n=1 Tax=Bradyrhizobium sp. LHD-71 TaxID=3072141 RepID=UPI00280C60AC|nr:hypothetical protein [Bradyrhizobium sp. LHD-71]MDQ8731065.1 hypothetical protein [Bradyrhizobium sp. LHD-71]
MATLIVLHTQNPAKDHWRGDVVVDVLIDVCSYKHPDMDRPFFVTLSEEGAVWLQFPHDLYEQVPDAGLRREGARRRGYVSRIRQIGDDLFVSGMLGQFYRLRPDGNRSHADDGLLDKGIPAVVASSILCRVVPANCDKHM